MTDPVPEVDLATIAARAVEVTDERELAQLRHAADEEIEAAVRSEDYRQRAVAFRAVGQMRFRAVHGAEGKGGEIAVTLNLPGVHNVRNALAAIAVGLELGVPEAAIAKALAEFKGVGRRFQNHGKVRLPGGGSFTLATHLQLEASNLWSSSSSCKWTYRDKSGLHDGIRSGQLAPGAAGRASIQFVAGGAELPLPAAISSDRFLAMDPVVTVQLHNGSGLCWQSEFSQAVRNTAEKFKARRKPAN